MFTSVGMGPSTSVIVKGLASLAEKSDIHFDDDDECDLMQAVLAFHSSTPESLCMRGARSSFRRPATAYDPPALIAVAIE